LFYLVSLLVFAIDRAIKVLVSVNLDPAQSIPVIKNLVHLTYVQNTGVAFGFFRGQRLALGAIGLAVCAVVVYFHARLSRKDALIVAALAVILGGSLGNLYDRVFLGYVIDYIDLRVFPVFNLADIAINIGVLLIIFGIFVKGAECIQ
jgi:signal peptidase II